VVRTGRRRFAIHLGLALAIGAAAGCASDNGGSAGSTSVATVAVSPSTQTLSVGDMFQLSATPKTAAGDAITGKTITWTSSAGSVATVSAAGTVTGVAVGTATITAAVDGKSGTATISVQTLPKIVLDQSAAVTQAVNSTGATLTAVSAGITYRLVVPPGAIPANVSITMTPLVTERQLPAGGAFVGGVKFDPTGTTFLKPLTLTMVSHVTPPAGQVIVGYMANDTGGVTELTHSTRTTDSLTLTLYHFSVSGWGEFAPGEVAAVPITVPSTDASFYLSFIAARAADPSATADQFAGIFGAWYADHLGPELMQAGSFTEFEVAASDFSVWDQTATDIDNQFHFQPTLASRLTAQRQGGVTLLPRDLLGAIAYHNNLCIATRDLSDVLKSFLMQDIAQQFGVATAANGLDAPTVLNGLCVKVVNSLASFPATPLPNQPAQLDLQYGLKFGEDPNLQNGLFKVTMTLSGTTTNGQQLLQTDPQGRLSGAITPTGTADLVAAMKTCIHPSVGYRLDEVCLSHSVTRQFGRTINADVIVNSQAGLAGLVGVSRINGNLSIGGPITSTDLSELTQLNTVTGRLQIFDTPSLRSLAGLANLRVVGDLTLGRLVNVTDFTPLSGVPAVATLTLTGMPQVTSLAAFGGMSYSGLVITQMPGLTTLSDLKNAPGAMTGPITLSGNARLFDASVLRNVVTVGGSFSVTGNPLFTTLNDFVGLTQVTGAVVIGGTGLTAPGPASLAHIGGSLTVNVNELDALSTFDLPGLEDVGGDLVLDDARNAPGSPASAPLLVRLSALELIGNNVSGGGGASRRIFDLSLPNIALIGGGDLSLLTGLRNLAANGFVSNATIEISGDPDLKTLVLGGIHANSGGWIEIDGNPSLATLQFTGAIHADGNMEFDQNASLASIQFAGGTAGGFFEIDQNPVLASLSGTFSSVGIDLAVDQNPDLSTAAAMAWAAQVAVGGTKEFNQDKIP
jgi:hypothetical protein